jgi:serine/threonine-protein kinase
MPGKIGKIVNRLLTSRHPLLRAGDRLFEKAMGGKIRLERPALAMGPAEPLKFSIRDDNGEKNKIEFVFDAVFQNFDSDLVMGEKGMYRMVRKFAEGGMSKIFLVEDVGGTKYLLKEVINASEFPPKTRRELLQRFRYEMEIMQKIDSENVVKYFDRDPHTPPRFFVMEYIQGIDLQKMLNAGRQISPRVSLTIISEVLKGLIAFENAVREKGKPVAAHRDLKEENILLEIRDKSIKRVVLCDFGVAKLPQSELTGTMQFLGTPSRAAPEVFPGGAKHVDQRADIYSLGTVLYWLLTGREPYNINDHADYLEFFKNPAALLARVMADQPENVSNHLWSIVSKAMAARPEQRYQSYADFKSALALTLRASAKIG